DDVICGQHVVGVELVDGQDVDLADVAQGDPCDVLEAVEHDERLRQLTDRGQGRDRRLGAGDVAGDDLGDDVDAAVTRTVGQGATQGGGHHLLGGALRVVAGLRAVDDATAGPDGRATRPV